VKRFQFCFLPCDGDMLSFGGIFLPPLAQNLFDYPQVFCYLYHTFGTRVTQFERILLKLFVVMFSNPELWRPLLSLMLLFIIPSEIVTDIHLKTICNYRHPLNSSNYIHR